MIYKELTVVKRASQAAQVIKNPLAMQEMQETLVRSLGWEIPWRRKRKHTPVFLSGIFHGQRSLAGSMGVSKSWTPTEGLSRHSCCQKKIQRTLLDMNSLWSENQTVNKGASKWKVLRS